jgi:anti-anti-sigma factor
MEVLEQNHGAVTVLRPKGPLVQSDAEELLREIHAAMDKTLGRVVLDASSVPFVDSRGLEILSDLGEEFARSGRAMKLCCTNDTLREVLDLTELTGLFEFYEDANAAVRSFL